MKKKATKKTNPTTFEKARAAMKVDLQAALIDAEEMHHKQPDRFWAPSLDPECAGDFKALTAGDFVKVCALGGRFWVIILNRKGTKMTAMVDNALLGTEDGLVLDYGDLIEIEDRHVYDYQAGSDGSRNIAKWEESK